MKVMIYDGGGNGRAVPLSASSLRYTACKELLRNPPNSKNINLFYLDSAQLGQDGFGGLPPRSRKWYTRRHRRYFIVKDTKGDVFEIYLDYSNRSKQSWWLVTRFDKEGPPSFTEQPPGAK